jgi:hypothetical protein
VDVIRQESGHPIGQETWYDTERAQWILASSEDKQLSRAAVHFYQMPKRHTGSAPYLQTRRVWQQMVNGAWLDFYCMGPLSRLEDRAAVGPLRELYRFHNANEKWLLHTESAAEVGLLYDAGGDDMHGWVQILSEHHVPFELVSLGSSDFQHCKTIIVPNCQRINKSGVRALDEYVKKGGKLLLSGKMPEEMSCFGDVKLKKTWPMRNSMYLRIDADDKASLAEAPLMDFDLVHLRGEFYEYQPAAGTQTHLKLIHDVMYGPPEKCYYKGVSDIPGLLLNTHREGTAALLPFEIGQMYKEWGHQGHASVAIGTLDHLLKTDRRLKVDTSALVEISHRKDPAETFEWISFYNHSGHLENVYHPPIPVHDLRIQLRPLQPVTSIRSLKAGNEIPFIVKEDGTVEAVLPILDLYDVVLITYGE